MFFFSSQRGDMHVSASKAFFVRPCSLSTWCTWCCLVVHQVYQVDSEQGRPNKALLAETRVSPHWEGKRRTLNSKIIKDSLKNALELENNIRVNKPRQKVKPTFLQNIYL